MSTHSDFSIMQIRVSDSLTMAKLAPIKWPIYQVQRCVVPLIVEHTCPTPRNNGDGNLERKKCIKQLFKIR